MAENDKGRKKRERVRLAFLKIVFVCQDVKNFYGEHHSQNHKLQKDIKIPGVAHLVRWSLPTPENHSSNPSIIKILSTQGTLNWKEENKEKEDGRGPCLKRT